MDENDILANTHFDDAVAKGAFPMDIHSAKTPRSRRSSSAAAATTTSRSAAF